MGDIDKPFICTNEGCNMTFANEDHLNVHNKKHDMVLQLGLAKTSAIADQTPTPTRFIRNCEEVGLFQDLQNVNPFEETFRKAVENSNNGIVHVPEINSEDTLHTPQIFHNIEKERSDKFNEDKMPKDFSGVTIIVDDEDLMDLTLKTDRFSKNNEIYIKEISPKHNFTSVIFTSTESEIDNSSPNSYDSTEIDDVTPSSTYVNNSKIELRSKLKEALQNKRKIEEDPLDITDQEVSQFKIQKPKLEVDKMQPLHLKRKDIIGKSETIDIYDKNVSEIDKRRLMNRKAQMRSRERKKMWLDQMQQEITKLRTDNKLLTTENQKLKNENVYLKSTLIKHGNCSLNIDLQKQPFAPSPNSSEKKFKPIKPRPTILSTAPSTNPGPQIVTKIQIPPSQKILLDNSSPKVITPATSVVKELPRLLPKPVIITKPSVIANQPVITKSSFLTTSVLPKMSVIKQTPVITTQSSQIFTKALPTISASGKDPMFIQLKMSPVLFEIKSSNNKRK